MHQFDIDIALTKTSPDQYEVAIAEGWRVNVGPNGGYVAAILLNAAKQSLPNTRARSFNCHFVAASVAGFAEVSVTVLKRGRTLSTANVVLHQNQRAIATALVTLGSEIERKAGQDDIKLQAPPMPSPEEVPIAGRMNSNMPVYSPFRDKYDQRIALGPIPPQTSEMAKTAGWTRFRQPRKIDDLALLAISDSWFPSVFAAKPAKIHTPTIEHTVHFFGREELDMNDNFLAVEFETRNKDSEFLIEDGCIWNSAGALVARSRQLAIVLEGDRY